MKRKCKQLWSSVPPISTKQAIQIIFCLNYYCGSSNLSSYHPLLKKKKKEILFDVKPLSIQVVAALLTTSSSNEMMSTYGLRAIRMAEKGNNWYLSYH
jgi:hypothetical protein